MARTRKPTAPQVGSLTIAGVEYVVIPKADYLRGPLPPGTVDAVAYARASLAADLKAAREKAGISQAELAARLGKSQPMIARAESGDTRVGSRYVAAVLKACGLPADWVAPRPKRSK